MATYTTNYNLKKPDTTDLVDVADLNGNADIIDTALAGKQATLTFDNTPTASSTNPVTSGGVYSALLGKQDALIPGTGIDITGNVISATGGGLSYDLYFSADSATRINSRTVSSATVTNASMVALKTMDALLDGFDDNKQLSISGGFKWSYEVATGVTLDYYITPTINDIAKVPNAIAQALMPGLPLGNKDVLIVLLTAVNNADAYNHTWGVYEDTNGDVQTLQLD